MINGYLMLLFTVVAALLQIFIVITLIEKTKTKFGKMIVGCAGLFSLLLFLCLLLVLEVATVIQF